MMGAGFGGCTINLVRAEQLESFEQLMVKVYHKKLLKEALIYVTEITNGTEILRERVMNI
jgi:galactokinase